MSLFIYCSKCGHEFDKHKDGVCYALRAGRCPCTGWSARIEYEKKAHRRNQSATAAARSRPCERCRIAP